MDNDELHPGAQESVVEKIRRALRETGVTGVARRGTRVGLEALARALDRGAQRLMDVEVEARLTQEQRAAIARNSSLRGCLAGRRAFIIGNGPSLRRQDVRLMKDDVTFAVNAFWKHEVVGEFQPTYYTVTDDLFYDGSESSREFFADLTARVTESTFFAPVLRKDVVESHNLLPLDRTFFIAKDGLLTRTLARDVDLTTVLPAPGTVLMTSIMIAIYMKASPIIVIGADHDWLAHQDESAHFYEGNTVLDQPQLAENIALGTYRRRLENVRMLWRGWEILRKLAAERDITIVNGTDGGFLDVFPRVRYEELFEDC